MSGDKDESEVPQAFMLIAIPTSLVMALQSGRSGMIENGSSICGAASELNHVSSAADIHEGDRCSCPDVFTGSISDSMHIDDIPY